MRVCTGSWEHWEQSQDNCLVYVANCKTPYASTPQEKYVVTKFPWADIYSGRPSEATPGTLVVRGVPQTKERLVAALCCRYDPVQAHQNNEEYRNAAILDSPDNHETWMETCLGKLDVWLHKYDNRTEQLDVPYTLSIVLNFEQTEEVMRMLQHFEKTRNYRITLYPEKIYKRKRLDGESEDVVNEEADGNGSKLKNAIFGPYTISRWCNSKNNQGYKDNLVQQTLKF